MENLTAFLKGRNNWNVLMSVCERFCHASASFYIFERKWAWKNKVFFYILYFWYLWKFFLTSIVIFDDVLWEKLLFWIETWNTLGESIREEYISQKSPDFSSTYYYTIREGEIFGKICRNLKAAFGEISSSRFVDENEKNSVQNKRLDA